MIPRHLRKDECIAALLFARGSRVAIPDLAHLCASTDDTGLSWLWQHYTGITGLWEHSHLLENSIRLTRMTFVFSYLFLDTCARASA